jgi:hypothetical protein
MLSLDLVSLRVIVAVTLNSSAFFKWKFHLLFTDGGLEMLSIEQNKYSYLCCECTYDELTTTK